MIINTTESITANWSVGGVKKPISPEDIINSFPPVIFYSPDTHDHSPDNGLTVSFNHLGNVPTTLDGYGITDAIHITHASYSITGFGTSATALGPFQLQGTATTVSRSDHVHPYPSASDVGAMSISHAAYSITGFGTTATSLDTSQSPGTATTVSRSDHKHPYPTASNVGAMATSHAANSITGFGATANVLSSSQSPGTATTVSRSDHIHPYPSAGNVGAMATTHPANAITGFGTTATALATSQSPGSGSTYTVSRSDHVHPLPSYSDIGAAGEAHTHSYTAMYTDIIPGSNLNYNLGSTSKQWLGAIIRDVYSDSIRSYNNSFLACYDHFYPGSNLTYNLGSSSLKWNNIYINNAYMDGVVNPSDERLKNNVTPIKLDGLNKIKSFVSNNGIIEYELKSHPDIHRHGFSAQKIKKSIPEASDIIPTTEGNEPMLGWKLEVMIAMLVDAVAEIGETLDNINSRLTKLENNQKHNK